MHQCKLQMTTGKYRELRGTISLINIILGVKMFKCDHCGCCCRSLFLSPIYANLDRGDGVCKYLDEKASLCLIYEFRPLECNIDAMYEAYYSSIMSKADYYELNYSACKELKQNKLLLKNKGDTKCQRELQSKK